MKKRYAWSVMCIRLRPLYCRFSVISNVSGYWVLSSSLQNGIIRLSSRSLHIRWCFVTALSVLVSFLYRGWTGHNVENLRVANNLRAAQPPRCLTLALPAAAIPSTLMVIGSSWLSFVNSWCKCPKNFQYTACANWLAKVLWILLVPYCQKVHKCTPQTLLSQTVGATSR